MYTSNFSVSLFFFVLFAEASSVRVFQGKLSSTYSQDTQLGWKFAKSACLLVRGKYLPLRIMLHLLSLYKRHLKQLSLPFSLLFIPLFVHHIYFRVCTAIILCSISDDNSDVFVGTKIFLAAANLLAHPLKIYLPFRRNLPTWALYLCACVRQSLQFIVAIFPKLKFFTPHNFLASFRLNMFRKCSLISVDRN